MDQRKLMEERTMNILEMKYLRSLVGVSLMDRIRNEEEKKGN